MEKKTINQLAAEINDDGFTWKQDGPAILHLIDLLVHQARL